MERVPKKWLYLIGLSLVWGSSFILIKKALIGLTPFQLGALRIIFAALFLFAFGLRKVKGLRTREWKWITVSALLGTFIPAFLLAFAETEIDSSIASILNSTTPIMALILGATLFGIQSSRNQLIGVIVGLIGSVLLIYAGSEVNPNQNYWYAGLVLMCSICYAFNVNIIKRHLQEVPALAITVGHFIVGFVPAIIVLFSSGFFSEATFEKESLLPSLGYLLLLALIGTAIAKTFFNKLVQLSTPVFASSVTYMIPVVALIWGLVDGENFSVFQALAATIIIFGVYLANRKKKSKEKSPLA
ncbi:EamA family transporter [Flavobacteriaceae bacterium TK19130]|nr:EamA family transporter [Thermobacterium salinum]